MAPIIIMIILINKLGEFCLLEKTKIMLYLPTEVTPNYSSAVNGV